MSPVPANRVGLSLVELCMCADVRQTVFKMLLNWVHSGNLRGDVIVAVNGELAVVYPFGRDAGLLADLVADALVGVDMIQL